MWLASQAEARRASQKGRLTYLLWHEAACRLITGIGKIWRNHSSSHTIVDFIKKSMATKEGRLFSVKNSSN